MYILEMFGVSLLMTLLLELPTARLLGLRGRRCVLLVVLVNILTNPAAVLLCWMGMPQLIVELAVVAVEALVYAWFSKERPWRISAVCNAVSWLTGVLLQRIGG